MTCNTCHGRAADRNGVCACARDIGALVDTMQQTARALDPAMGTNPANIVELFHIVNRYNAAMAAVDCITRPTK
jgi:hypothetical protein